ncbi:MAG: hypothetical protein F7B18_04465 [Desulfurococcales archaeon]|nr:hypothetical protein [Desulfurococcales archaeon]
MSIEERLERLERLLREVLERLDKLEKTVAGEEAETVRNAARLVASSIAPAAVALEAARRLIEAVKRAGSLDPISRSIVEALSTCEDLTTMEITRRVRRIRGTASRRIIASRLEMLERRRVVERIQGSRPRYRLVLCREEATGVDSGGGQATKDHI